METVDFEISVCPKELKVILFIKGWNIEDEEGWLRQ
jgi:hypothetical protein